MNSLCRILSFCLLVFLPAERVSAHAFLERSDPAVGGKIHSAPAAVRIWFMEAIEPASSSIQVFDATGKQVDKKDTHSDRSSRSLLQISLPRLGPGTYKVAWGVVSVDTHVTKGDFRFSGKDETNFPAPRAWHQGLLAELRQDTPAAHSAFNNARSETEKLVRAQPGNATPLTASAPSTPN